MVKTLPVKCPFDLLKDNSIDMVKEYLFELAIVKSGGKPIYPVGTKSCFDECFTEEINKDGIPELMLWFDDSSGSTHTVSQYMDVDKLYKGE